MNPKPSPRLALLLLAAPVLFASAGNLAAQSAPSIAAGGVVPNHDARIAVAKEVVHISDRKVVVEYDLRNDGPSDVTTDLEFPVPPYKNEWNMVDPAIQAFRSLKLWADEQPIEYKADSTAEVDGRDVTKTLEKAHIDIPSFGHLELGRDQHGVRRKVFAADYERLTLKERHRLRGEGIFKGDEGYCLYTVHLRYHWPQSIPAHSTVHIRQEYMPVVGFTTAPPQADALQAALRPVSKPVSNSAAAATDAPSGGSANELNGFCADTKFIQTMIAAHKSFAQQWGQGILPHWVDYDLLSARDWPKPIEDFTLVIDAPQPEPGLRTVVSFCAPGVVEKRDSDHPLVHLTNFSPAAGLHIGFFNAPLDAPESPVAAR